MAFKKRDTNESYIEKKDELPKSTKDDNSKNLKKEEIKTISAEEVFINHEKRLAHIESVLLQLRNSI